MICTPCWLVLDRGVQRGQREEAVARLIQRDEQFVLHVEVRQRAL
ncbi:hypothetical protein [Cupriavidus sp. IDO]